LNKSIEDIKVDFGHDGNKCAIYLSKGNSGNTTKWFYPSVLIRDVFVSFSNVEPEKWNSGWNVGFTTTLGNNIKSMTAFSPLNNNTLSNERHIVSPKGGQSSMQLSTTAEVTGYLKITLPQSWSNTMMKMTIDIYDYRDNMTRTLNISGYNHASQQWYHTTVNQQSSDIEDIKVDFGHDGNKCAIYLSKGNSSNTTKWFYPSVLIRDVFVSFSNVEPEKWNSGWNVGFTTTLGNNIKTLIASASWQGISETPNALVKIAGSLKIGNPRTASGYGLMVGTGILASKIKVATVNSDSWSDFVFEKDYKLKTLSEVEKFIEKNKHLPEIPSANEVSKNGVDMIEMDAKLLQKVEELTLYLIKQEKRLEAQQKEIKELKKTIKQK
jgi:hypothetical protein